MKKNNQLPRKIFGRFLRAISVAFWVMVLSFAIIRLAPGDPATARLGVGAEQEAIDVLRKQLHLGGNPFSQFFGYLADVLHGNFGVSLQTGVSVLDILRAPCH
ncbi:MAG: hypothetical protein WDO06_01675 [Actinomycetota bacterium]